MIKQLMLFIALSLFFISCKKDPVGESAYKVVSMRWCPDPEIPVADDEVVISFENSSYKPTPNTWYKTEFNWWYKTGTDVNPVNSAVSFVVEPIPYTSSCR